MQTVPLFERAMVSLFPQFGASPTVSAGNGTGEDDVNRMQVDSLKKGKETGKGKHPNHRGTRTSNTRNTDINTCKNCGRTGHWVKDAGDHVAGIRQLKQEHEQEQEQGQINTKGKGKQLDVVQTIPPPKQPQLCRTPSQTPSAVEALWCKPDVQQKGWIMTLGAVTINCSPHGDKLVQSIRFLTVC